MMQPKVEARILQELALQPHESAYEVGTGSGYFTALLARRARSVTSAEIHASEDRHGVMHMQALDALDLPAGQRVELKPGGFHIMLVGLKRALPAGERVPLTFTIEDGQGRRTQLEVLAEVRPLGR